MDMMLDVDGSQVRLHREGDGGRIIVYLHSGSGEVCSTPFFAELARNDATIFVPEFPGFGGTRPLPQRLRRVEDAVFHLRRVLDLLAPRRQVTLVGSSFGGWLAAELATWFPDRFEAVVLIDAAGLRIEGAPIFNIFGVPGQQEDLQAELARRSNPHGVDLLKVIAPAFADKDIPPDDARMLHSLRAGSVIAQLGWNPYLHDTRLRGRLHMVAAPTLVLWGEDDRLVPIEHGQAYATEIPGAELVVIPGAGHLPALERPDVAARHIDHFLSSASRL